MCICSKQVVADEQHVDGGACGWRVVWMFSSRTDLVVGERVVGDGKDGDDVFLDKQPHQRGD